METDLQNRSDDDGSRHPADVLPGRIVRKAESQQGSHNDREHNQHVLDDHEGQLTRKAAGDEAHDQRVVAP